jgi:formylmethanofuran dehydrogenase subunit E
MQHETRKCNRCKNDFDLDQDDFSFYEKMKVPAPNVCPDCRFKMRAQWRNEMTLYSGRKCELCGKSILSMYNPKLPHKIYCTDCWYSDKWEPKDYGIEYDKSKPFFEQLGELIKKVPKDSLGMSFTDGPNTNTPYANMAAGCKSCYLVFNTSPAEELLYSRGVKYGNFSSDIYFGVKFENCYDCVNVQDSANVRWGQNINSCVDSSFLLNCSGLMNCVGCVNMRHKSNCWFNEQLTADEYKKRLEEVRGSYKKVEEFKKKFEEFCKTLPRRANNNIKTVNSTGDYLTECKNVQNSFEVARSEDCRYLFSSKMIKDSLGTIGFGTNSENLLEVVATGYSNNVIGTYWAENCSNVINCFDIRNCHDCIGCDALKNSKYCILNKQYSKEEYEELKNHIIKELTENGNYGLIMPPEIAPFGYNETIAQDNMPLTKEEALAHGFKWEDDTQMTTRKETILPSQIPDHIKDVQDSITKEILRCIDCERNYKITEQELLFYKKLILPIPRKCFFCRHKDRIEKRGAMKFFVRDCSNCGEEVYTNLTEETAPIIYCEKCYQKEII